jgi:hypothetical protein
MHFAPNDGTGATMAAILIAPVESVLPVRNQFPLSASIRHDGVAD